MFSKDLRWNVVVPYPKATAPPKPGGRRAARAIPVLAALLMVASTVLPGAVTAVVDSGGESPPAAPVPMAQPEAQVAAEAWARLAFIQAVIVPNLLDDRRGANEAAAISSLRTLVSTQALFRDLDLNNNSVGDYAGSLRDLAELGLIDGALGSGVKQGYHFSMDNESEQTNTYEWAAYGSPGNPGKTGSRYFFVDETGVIRAEHCEPATANSSSIDGPSPQATAAEDKEACKEASEALDNIGRRSMAESWIMTNGGAVSQAASALKQGGDAFVAETAEGFDLDGDGAISFHELMEDSSVLALRFQGAPQAGSQGNGSGNHSGTFDSFFDITYSLYNELATFLQLGLYNEVVNFTVTTQSVTTGGANATLEFLDSVPVLDHFRCYATSGKSVRDVASLQDAFDVADQSSDTVKVLDPRLFCNPARKIHEDGSGPGISNLDGHLTGYTISPVYPEDGWGGAPALVVAHNQFAMDQELKLGSPRYLLVPSQKVSVDGGTPTAGGGVPEGLDHLKCYDVTPRDRLGESVQVWDQFDSGNSPIDARVIEAKYVCTPTRKIHHDFEHNTVTGIENAAGSLVCYSVEAARHLRDVVVNNQFGDGQELTTKQTSFLCVPSVLRVPHANAAVLAAFTLLLEQIGDVDEGLLGKAAKKVFAQKLAGAHDAYVSGDLCLADNLLGAFLNHAQALRAGQGLGDDDDDDDDHDDDDDRGERGHDDDDKENGKGHDGDDKPGNGKGKGHHSSSSQESGTPQPLGDGSVRHPPDPGAVALAEDLFNRGLEILNGMSDPFFDVFFDVFVASSNCYNPAVGKLPAVQVLQSDNTTFEFELTLGQAQVWTVMGAGQAWTQLELPGLEARSGRPGLPGLPAWRGLVALPEGASAVMGIDPTPFVPPVDPDKPLRVNLLPYQGEAADQDQRENRSFDEEFADPPFVVDNATYSKDAFYPAEPCAVTPLGYYRDLQMAQVLCTAGQYNPVTDELRLFQKVRVDIDFRGGNGTFVTEQALNPFESAPSLYEDAVLNHAVVLKYVKEFDISSLVCWGEELLILTHPNFRSAADNLSAWKESKGIATSVLEVGSGTSYDTGAEIDDLIEGRYDDCIVRPSYVLLLGDAEWVPPSDTDWNSSIPGCSNCGDDTTGSDWGYATYPQVIFDVFFPDFAVGRMPVDTAAEADTVVNKTVAYESDPPFVNLGSGGPFYTTAGFASVFQCCRMNADGTPLGGQPGTTQRAFIETSEKARATLVSAGKSVERMYDETVDGGGYCTANPCPPNPIQQPYSGNTVPNRYYNGALMPAAIRAGSGFGWDATTTDIVNAFNDGRFLMLHRGHGSTSGWADPGFSSSNLGSLSNGELLPVVYSVNCASGKWDIETDSGGATESLMEQLLTKSGGGMVGGLGDNRNSPTWPNNALTRGFFDATWTSLAPEYGGGTSHRRLGDILNHGKVYMLTQVGVAQTAGSVSIESAVSEYIMWHAFGDPTLEMWTSNPHQATLGGLVQFELEGFDLGFKYATEGAVITVFEHTDNGTVPYGRAVVVNGVANVTAFNPDDDAPDLEDLTVVASLRDAVSVVLGQEEEEEDPNPQSLSLAPAAGADVELEGGVVDAGLESVDAVVDGGVLEDGAKPGDGLSGPPTRSAPGSGVEDKGLQPRPAGGAGAPPPTLGTDGAAAALDSSLEAAALSLSGWVAFAALALFAARGPLLRGASTLRKAGRGGGSDPPP
jgi:hypothetical protein